MPVAAEATSSNPQCLGSPLQDCTRPTQWPGGTSPSCSMQRQGSSAPATVLKNNLPSLHSVPEPLFRFVVKGCLSTTQVAPKTHRTAHYQKPSAGKQNARRQLGTLDLQQGRAAGTGGAQLTLEARHASHSGPNDACRGWP